MSSITFFNQGASIAAGTSLTISWSTSVSGLKYYNSTGNATHGGRFTSASARSGTLTSATSAPFQSVGVTAREPINLSTGAAISSGTVQMTLRTGNTGGTVIATSPTFTIYRTPTNPNAPTFSNITTSSVTVSASGGQYGTLQVKRVSTSTWYTAPFTFTGLTPGTTYGFVSRRANVVAFSSEVGPSSVTLVATPLAPSLNPSATLGAGGFTVFANPSGPQSGFVTFNFARGGTNLTADPEDEEIGLGAAAFEGATITVTATATNSVGDTDTSSGSITLPSFSISANSSSIQSGNSNTMTVSASNLNGSQTIYWEATPSNRFSGGTGTGSLSVSNGSSNTFTLTTTALTTAATATVKIYTSSGHSASTEVGSTTFSLTAAPPPIISPGPPTVSSNNPDSSSVTATATGGGGSGGTLQFAQTSSNSAPSSGWQTGNSIDFSHPRGTTRYYWARRGPINVSTSTAHTVGYKSGIIDNNIVIGTLSPTSPLAASYGDDSGENVSVPYTGGAAGDQYRIKSNDTVINWISTQNGASGTFTLLGHATAGYHIPGNGQTFTYFFEGRRTPAGGADPSQGTNSNWVALTTPNITISRGAAANYAFDTSTATTVAEGGTAVWTVNTTAGSVPNGTTVGYTLSGGNITAADFSNLSSLTGNITIQNNTGTLSASLLQDNVVEGTETVTLTLAPQDSANNSTGEISRSISITDSLGSGTGATPDGGTGDYGLLLKNASGTTIIDNTSRVSNIISSGTYNTGTEGSSKVLFAGIDCTNAAETSFITSWSNSIVFYSQPQITRRSSGGGILLTKSVTDTLGGIATVLLIRY